MMKLTPLAGVATRCGRGINGRAYQPQSSRSLAESGGGGVHDRGATIRLLQAGVTANESRLMGAFNVSTAGIGDAAGAGLSVNGFAENRCSKVCTVCGRMEVRSLRRATDGGGGITHTPDALEKLLQAARLHCAGKLWCVFGCGGDQTKVSAHHGAIAEEFAISSW